jgi:hypothetical protein
MNPTTGFAAGCAYKGAADSSRLDYRSADMSAESTDLRTTALTLSHVLSDPVPFDSSMLTALVNRILS